MRNINKVIKNENLGVITIGSKISKKGYIKSDGFVITIILKIGNVEGDDNVYGIKYGVSIKNEKDVNKPRIGKAIAYKRYKDKPMEMVVQKSEIDEFLKMDFTLNDIIPIYVGMNLYNRLMSNQQNIFSKVNNKNRIYKDFVTFLRSYLQDYYSKFKEVVSYKQKVKEAKEEQKEQVQQTQQSTTN
jgi:hypothetical protein